MSKWFATHIVMYVEIKGEKQKTFPVWENIVLVEAMSDEEAFEKAEKRGRESEGDDGGSFRWGGKSARWVFGGVRKVTLCQNADEAPSDGTEVTYIQMRVRADSLQKLIHSQPISVELREEFAQEETADQPTHIGLVEPSQ